MKNMESNDHLKECARINDEEIRGVKNAIKNFVEAKKGEDNQTDKGKKKSIIASAIKSAKK